MRPHFVPPEARPRSHPWEAPEPGSAASASPTGDARTPRRRYPVAVLPRSIAALALLALAFVVPASSGCTTPEEALPPAPEAPGGLVFVLTRDGQVRFGERSWSLKNSTQAAQLTVMLTRLAKGAEDPTLVFKGESGVTFAQVTQLMEFLELAKLEDYRVDLGQTRRR